VETIEGEIIGRICDKQGMLPSEVIAIKHTRDGFLLWRRNFRIIMAELDEKERLKELERNANA
jgi:hypothetical protein